MSRFTRFAVFTLVFNVGVVLYGAVVRATGSGAGCGSHWPTCGGDVVPMTGSAERFIEFGHRASSGIALLLVGALVVWAVRTRRSDDPVRGAAIASGILIVNEALIGAALVLFEWVADDRSVARAVSITIHLINTFLLLAALALTVWWSLGRPAPKRGSSDRSTRRLVLLAAAGLLLVGAAGAITALGDTLFPPDDPAGSGNFLVRLRWIHPIVAVAVATYLIYLSRVLEVAHWMRSSLAALVVVQLGAGLINVALAAPVWMQVVHLLIADAIWILFVVTASAALSERSELVMA